MTAIRPPTFQVARRSDLGLEDVSRIISSCLLSNLPFESLQFNDGVPTAKLMILGCELKVTGGMTPYIVTLRPCFDLLPEMSEADFLETNAHLALKLKRLKGMPLTPSEEAREIKDPWVDFSAFIAYQLRACPGIEVID